MNYDDEKYPSGESVVINGFVCRIGEIINIGADGRVYAASYGGSTIPTVVKYFLCEFGDELWDNALMETEAAARLSKCPNAVDVLGTAIKKRADGLMEIFMLMPRLTSFEDMLVSGRSTPELALRMAADICDAIAFMSGIRLVHCDIKPSNIFFDGERWQLGDFGCIQLKGKCIREGSAAYRSPEASEKKNVDHRSDIYSLGIVLYRAVSGRLPFCDKAPQLMSEEDVYNAISRRLSGEPLPEIEGVSPEINDVILGMCAFDKRKRARSTDILKRNIMKILQTNVVAMM